MLRELADKFKAMFKAKPLDVAKREAQPVESTPVNVQQERDRIRWAVLAFKSLIRRTNNRVGAGQGRPEGKRDAHPPGFFWKRDMKGPHWRLYRTRAS